MIPLLSPDSDFPPLCTACADLGDLLAVGADLSPKRLLNAYRQGIFPWGTHDGLPVWYAPDPRTILLPNAFLVSRTLRRTLRRQTFSVSCDSAFDAVITGCATQFRTGQAGTWITPDMIYAYSRLHELGWAHSVEVWADGELAGGLYGLALGRAFFGESMFSRRTDASKVALAHLCRFLSAKGFGLIDCQMHTPHLASLGAESIARDDFVDRLANLCADAHPARWPTNALQATWN